MKSYRSNQNRRSTGRIPLQLPLHLSLQDGTRQYYDAMSVNLHNWGARITTNAEIVEGEAIHLLSSQGVTRINIPNILGEIRWAGINNGMRCYGVSFQEDVRMNLVNLKETLASLKEAKEASLAQSVLNSIPDAVISINRNCRITSFNTSAEIITGWKRTEVIGRKYSDFHTMKCSRQWPNYEGTGQGKLDNEKPISLITREGNWISVSCTSTPLMSPEGEKNGEVQVFRKISDFNEKRVVLESSDSSVDSLNPVVDIRTFGKFCLTVDGQPIYDRLWKGRRSKELLKTIIALGGTKVSMEKISSLLWPDSDGDRGLNNLKMALSRLRRIGDSNFAMPLNWLVIKHRRVSLVQSVCRVDALDFCREIENISDKQSKESLQQTLKLYRKDFLYQDEMRWISSFRDHLRKLFIKGVLRLAYLGSPRDETLLSFLEQAHILNPLHEGIYASLMQYYLGAGLPATALNIFNKAEKKISRRTGTRPGVALRSLALQAKTH